MINVKRTKLDMFSSDMNGAVTAVVSWRVGGLGYRSVRHLNTTHLKHFPYRSSIAICKHINKKGVIIFDDETATQFASSSKCAGNRGILYLFAWKIIIGCFVHRWCTVARMDYVAVLCVLSAAFSLSGGPDLKSSIPAGHKDMER